MTKDDQPDARDHALSEASSALPPIVDTHLHFLDLNHFDYPWLSGPGEEHLRHDYLPADWVQDAGSLDIIATVHIQAEVDHDTDPVAETSWLETIASSHNGIRLPSVCIGYADLRAHDLSDVLDRHQEHASFRGIRQEAWYTPGSQRADMPTTDLLADPRWIGGLRQLSARGLIFELLVWPHQLERATEILRGLPEFPVVIEHLGVPNSNPADRTLWRKNLTEIARTLPRATLKISGMQLCSELWTMGAITDVIHEAIDAFSAERCMFGSNFPVDRPLISYEALWRTFGEITRHLSQHERLAIFAQNAIATYQIR
ncbi:amidohydrolase family protein [Acrocarpospora catenulata]|uniref:amidohydrolase family protein n=1 Tax=Acrocarpospora catenulata TaxID=2836182 RepID=UPI001BDAAA8F|nr:amidohydrolase family protein [Acrocarpospora catenulata]